MSSSRHALARRRAALDSVEAAGGGGSRRWRWRKMRMGLRLMAVVAAWSLALLLSMSGAKASHRLEVLSLLVFKAGLTNSSALFSWNQLDPTPCQWLGVLCDPQSQMVSELRLDGMSLSGPIGQTLADLTNLRALSLSRNNFSSRFPDAVARIPSLRSVNLSGNALSGPIPPVFGNGSLEDIDLSFNAFSGELPPDIFSTNRESLSIFSVASNEMLGSIPPEFYDCAMLSYFNFSSNRLSGNLSGEIGRLGQLLVADASYNVLSGAIPETISSLVNLRELWLTANADLNGPLPDGLGSVVKLEVLDVSFNALSGSLPDFSALSMLRVLNLRGNRFEGGIPLWIGSLDSLTTLDLAGNMFSGSIPSGLGLLHSLQRLFLFDNRLTGSLPTALGSLAVSDADLSLNGFTGPIPSDLITTNLRMLNLSYNQLSRTTSLGNCGFLQGLDLSQNYLTGGLPADIGNCVALLSLDVSDNSLTSFIPREIGNLVLLQSLDLSNNSFNGSIPGSLGSNKQLLALYLSDNVLSGPIPVELGDCGLLEELDLSVNNLSGTIPAEMGNLSRLQWLDVSYNSLSGAIPADLGQLANLAMINVSNNRLQGAIPEGGVFSSTVNATVYAGNAGLCGRAINVSCDDAAGDKSHSRDVLRPRTRAITVSALVAICVAAAVALGVVVVTLCSIHAQQKRNRAARGGVLALDSATESGNSPDLAMGKLVMFPRKGETRTDSWMSEVRGLINKDCEIGRGAFGTVYRAVLPDGQPVAVKKLLVAGLVKSQEEFEREVQALGKVRHQHIVALQGYYWSKQVQLLIYDYVSGGNLYSRLHERAAGEPVLDWPSRFRIAMGTALGLAHLHHSQRPAPLIHYDIKSSNILLGERDEPRISDAGLAKLLPILDTYVMSSKFQSALGYMAPEFACQNVRISEKCDVYGFGVLLLELVTGRRPVEYAEDDVVVLAESMRSLLEQGTPLVAVDPELYYYAEDEVLPLIKLGLICTSQIPSHRPSMAEVIQILELIKPLVEEDKSSS